MAISGAASKVAKKFQNSKINQKLTKKLEDVTSSLKSKTKNITANIAKKTKEATQKAVNTVSDKAKTIANKTLSETNTVKNAISNGIKNAPKSAKNKVDSVIDNLGEGILSVRNVFAPQKVINAGPIKIAVKDIKTGFGQSGEETLSQFLSKDVKQLKTMFFSQGNKSGSKTKLASYYEYKVLKQQGYNASEAHDLMKQFRSGMNPNNEFVFHFTTMKGGKGITDIGGIYGSKSGVWGKGIYTGTTPTPSWALKHIPWSGWGLGNAPVRIPIKLNSSMTTSKPIIPIKSVVIRTEFLEF
ncbi:MAG: hypothetical protein V8R02_07315 [Clostridium sp.]